MTLVRNNLLVRVRFYLLGMYSNSQKLLRNGDFATHRGLFEFCSSICDKELKTNLSSLFRLLPMPSPLVCLLKNQ